MRCLVLTLTLALALGAQPPRDPRGSSPNPYASDPAAIEAGKSLYTAACAGCHGPTGEGGRGPNLSDGRTIRRATDEALFRSIQKGVPGTEMPAFPLPDQKVWQVVAFVRSLSAPAYSTKLPGDPVAGETVFFGKAGCVECHAIRGRGGALGPDLSHVGMRRSARQLREAVVDPNARWAEGYRAVLVTLNSARTIAGVAKNHTNYSVQVLDRAGELHLLPMTEVRSLELRPQSWMPDDYAKRLSKTELDDLLAFLSRQAVRGESH